MKPGLSLLGAVAAAGLALLMAALAPEPAVDEALVLADQPAPTLQAYHLFKDAGAQVPSAGVIPYALNTPLFTDYAEKARYLFIPPGARIGYRPKGVLDLPVGSVLIKSFSYSADQRKPGLEVRRIETRLLIHKKDGWVANAYVWNAEGTQAVLKRAGAHLAVSFTDQVGRRRDIDYGVPNVNQCKQCHSIGAQVSPIGPKARNLNGPFDYGQGPENQLAHLSRTGLLVGAPRPDQAPRTAVWSHASEPLEARARAYLDVNCGHCHNPQGLASNSGLYLDLEEDNMAVLGVGKRPVAAGRASGGLEFSIAPGDPDHSIIAYRLASTEPGVMMPQLGRSLVHEEGLKLVRDYIASLRAAPASAPASNRP